MNIGGYKLPLVVDLATLVTPQRIPLLFDHIADIEYVVGQSERVRIETGRLLVTGLVMGVCQKAVQIIRLAETGYVWQASVGGEPAYYDEVREGESATVNGRSVSGPCYIARKMDLKEVSFVSLGADSTTSAVLGKAPIRRPPAARFPRRHHSPVRRLVEANLAKAVRTGQPPWAVGLPR
jgi:hypothetical protein